MMKQAIDSMPEEEKKAYQKAVELVPDLIELESSPDRYLRFDNYDPWAAAKRLTEYWQVRQDLFEDRAFLPMTQTGEGTLDEGDLEVLSTGYFCLLPHDKQDRGVLFHDRARLTSPKQLELNRRMRVFFYLMNVASEEESCQRNGIVIMSVTGEKTRATTFQDENLMKGLGFVRKEVIPVKIRCVHLILLSKRPILKAVISGTLKHFERWKFVLQRTIVHSESDTEKLLDELSKYGFDPEGLPKVPVGGSWTFGCFKRWRDDRLLHEQHRYEFRSTENGKSLQELLESAESIREEDQRRQKREMDALYARRKRARKKIEMQVMQDEVDRLRRQQDSLRETGNRLEALLEQAQTVVKMHGGGQPFDVAALPFMAATSARPAKQHSVAAAATPQVAAVTMNQPLATSQQQQLLLQMQQQQRLKEQLLLASLFNQHQQSRAALAAAALAGSNLSSLTNNTAAAPQQPQQSNSQGTDQQQQNMLAWLLSFR
jgi:hypothetical protein